MSASLKDELKVFLADRIARLEAQESSNYDQDHGELCALSDVLDFVEEHEAREEIFPPEVWRRDPEVHGLIWGVEHPANIKFQAPPHIHGQLTAERLPFLWHVHFSCRLMKQEALGTRDQCVAKIRAWAREVDNA